MEVNFTYSYPDYRALTRAIENHGKYAKLAWIFLIGIILINIAISVFFIAWILLEGRDFKPIHFANAGLGLLLAFVFYILKPIYLKNYYKKQMLDGKLVHMSFNDKGLNINMPSFTGTHEWDAIILADQQPEHFFLWINKIQAYVVPKRSFASTADIENFKHLVAEKVTNQELIK